MLYMKDTETDLLCSFSVILVTNKNGSLTCATKQEYRR